MSAAEFTPPPAYPRDDRFVVGKVYWMPCANGFLQITKRWFDGCLELIQYQRVNGIGEPIAKPEVRTARTFQGLVHPDIELTFGGVHRPNGVECAGPRNCVDATTGKPAKTGVPDDGPNAGLITCCQCGGRR